MFYFKFNIGDYASHTQHLTILEDMAYRRLLEAYYLQERPLNAGIASVARSIRMREHESEVETVLKEFFKLTDSGWTNSRADREIADYHDKLEQASRAGKASAQRRLNGRSTDVQPNTKHKPLNKKQEPVTSNQTTEPDGFALFWSAYPKKTAKPAALKAFRSQKINGELSDILGDIERKAASDSWQKDGGQFIPNPATYLNQRRWEDGIGQQKNVWAGAI